MQTISLLWQLIITVATIAIICIFIIWPRLRNDGEIDEQDLEYLRRFSKRAQLTAKVKEAMRNGNYI